MDLLTLFLPEIKEMLAERDFHALRSLLKQINPIDLASGWHAFSSEEQATLFRLLPRHKVTQVFEELETPQQQALVENLKEIHVQQLLEKLEPSETSQFLRDLPPKLMQRLFRLMKQSDAGQVELSMTFPEESVGYIMRTKIVRLKPVWTTRQAVEHIQLTTRLKEIEENFLDNLYVTDDQGILLGQLPLKMLLVAPRDIEVQGLMQRAFNSLAPEADREEAAKLFERYKLNSIPVLDSNKKLLGVILVRDALKVIEQEATEDIQKLGGMEALDDPYFQTSFMHMVKKRATWLCVLFVGEMLTATAMAFFENQLAKAIVLALFIPLIISSGGNTGSQAATLVVRAMAIGEIKFGDWWRVMRREIVSGLILGCVLGSMGFLRIFLWSQFTPIYGDHYLLIAITVGLALVAVVLWGTVTGACLPILIRRLGLDPAVVSTPFVATLVDVTGLVIYFSVAMIVLRGTLL